VIFAEPLAAVETEQDCFTLAAFDVAAGFHGLLEAWGLLSKRWVRTSEVLSTKVFGTF
jgi:hypothetical protein